MRKTFDEVLEEARHALQALGTNALGVSEIRRQGPRAYAVRVIREPREFQAPAEAGTPAG